MLKLEKMDVAGFKSFSDRTSVEFRDGITAVVGPNGCGKSNIGDAINWVLGEQSPRMLRGRQMSDVIFNGSEARKAQGVAEVSLHLNGLNGAGDPRMVLTRRLFRSGESEYLLNGQRVRLKDIQEILRKEKVGAKTYATIEQGRIDQIINAKPRDIRLIIEEAAGVSGFKHKRRLTELKLEATQANLYRVNDIIGEVRRQINSLKRQAAKARRYQRLREELRLKQRARFALRGRAMDEQLARLRDAESRESDREAQLAARLSAVEAELAEGRAELDGLERAYRDLANRIHLLEVEIGREEAEIRRCRERIADSEQAATRLDAEADGLAGRIGALGEQVRAHDETARRGRLELQQAESELAGRQRELAELEGGVSGLRQQAEGLRARQFDAMSRLAETRNRRRSLEDGVERGRRQRERLVEERSSARDDCSRLDHESRELDEAVSRERERVERLQRSCRELDGRLAGARREHAERVESASAAREQEKSAAARLRTLEDVSTRFAGVSDGVRTLLTKGAESGVRTRGVIADFIEAGREVEGPAEAYLQGLLPTVILDDDDDAQRAVELLRSEGAGRTALICRSQPAGALAIGSPRNGETDFPAELLSDPRVRGRLREGLSLNTAVNGVLRDRIGDALLVDRLETALELHRRHPEVDFITQGGEVVYASGLVLAGGRTSDNGMLAHARRIQEAHGELDRAGARAAELATRVEESERARDALEDALRRDREDLEESRRRHVALALRAQSSSEERDRTRRRSGVLEQELAALDREAASLGEQLEACDQQSREAEKLHAEVSEDLEGHAALLGARERERAGLAEGVSALRAEVAALRQREQAVEAEGTRLREALAELQSRIRVLRDEAEVGRRRGAEAAAQVEALEARLVERLQEREASARRLEQLDRETTERRAELQERDRTVGSLRREFETVRESAREAAMARSRAESDRGHLDELCREELNVSVDEAAGLVDEAALSTTDLQELEKQITQLRGKIDGIGPVNIMAIEEFGELEERHEFLGAQKDDLERSMASLRETIRKINRTSRERFSEAFGQIRTYYQETFQSLFRGGRADLRLQEAEGEGETDVLECGIEIMAQPPGKRLSSVQLMSGGERAMSAIALLFAIFRYQPSPFCLLDEVDAPLDDVNVGRFTRMLRDYAAHTQFILITHNKISMESADLLYGVTMEEPGVSKVMSLQLQ